jgi:hypothetical protein
MRDREVAFWNWIRGRTGSSFLFPAEWSSVDYAGPEQAKNLAGKILRLIQIRLAP